MGLPVACYLASMRAFLLTTLVAPLLLLGACDGADEATKKGKKAASDAVDASKKAVDASKKAADDAVDATKKAVDASKKAADDAVDATKNAVDASKKAVDDAKKWWDDVPDTGELSDKTKAWLEKAADDSEASIEKALADGEQYAPTALEMAKGLSSAVDSETGFEPIYIKVEDKASADEKIGDMPKVQVIDDLTIGLKRVDAWEGLTKNKERGYLVLWREDDHLVGFVYRSRSEIDLEKVAAEAPKLVKLVRSVTADEDGEKADGADAGQ